MTGLYVFIAISVVISLIIVVVIARYAYRKMWALVAAACCLVGIGGMAWFNWATTYQNDRWEACTVTGKDRGADDGSYRIYTSDCGQLANQDSLLRWKFDSADIWQKIPDEGVVELRVAGARWPFFSQFPNVFDVREVHSQG